MSGRPRTSARAASRVDSPVRRSRTSAVKSDTVPSASQSMEVSTRPFPASFGTK